MTCWSREGLRSLVSASISSTRLGVKVARRSEDMLVKQLSGRTIKWSFKGFLVS
jgi:hypothetical protein